VRRARRPLTAPERRWDHGLLVRRRRRAPRAGLLRRLRAHGDDAVHAACGGRDTGGAVSKAATGPRVRSGWTRMRCGGGTAGTGLGRGRCARWPLGRCCVPTGLRRRRRHRPPGRSALPDDHRTRRTLQRGPYQQPIGLTVELVPLPVPAMRHVRGALGPAGSADVATHVLARSAWRRHEARARRWHFQRHRARA
jgi:hypothetical protein